MVKFITLSRLQFAAALAFSLFFLLFFSFQMDAQSTSKDPIYFNVEKLNPDNYTAIKAAINEDGRFEVVESCIPAGIIGVQTSYSFSDSEKQLTEFRTLVKTSSGISRVKTLEDYDREKFMAKCKEYRTNRP